MGENEALQYYREFAYKFDLWDEEGKSPADGQVIYNKESKGRWTPFTCNLTSFEHNGETVKLDFDKFVAGELESRAQNRI